MWGFKELRRTLEKDGWKKTDFMVNLNPPNNPRSNGGYEDSTLPLIDRGEETRPYSFNVFTQQIKSVLESFLQLLLDISKTDFVWVSLLGGKQDRDRDMIPMNDIGPGKTSCTHVYMNMLKF